MPVSSFSVAHMVVAQDAVIISDFMLSVTEKRNLRPDVAKRKETGIMQKVRSMRRTESEMDR
jgi:hypothetical protein